jgi:long-chain acyl-CoA synthetase
VRFGTVGIPIPGVEVKIDEPNKNEEGEILVKGPNVMLGYFKNEDSTKEVIDGEGWFRTGDIGKIVHKRFLQITDRKKDIFKTSSGKFIAPQFLENLLKTSPYIEQSMIVGFKRPFPTALIVPNFIMLKVWCQENNVHWTAPQYMVINPKVIQLFKEEIERLNETLENYQRLRNFNLLHEIWSEESGELTSTLKLKRAVIAERFAKEIDQMYTED